MAFLLEHSYLGWDVATLLALLVAVASALYYVIRHRRFVKKQEALEEELKNFYESRASETPEAAADTL